MIDVKLIRLKEKCWHTNDILVDTRNRRSRAGLIMRRTDNSRSNRIYGNTVGAERKEAQPWVADY